MAIIKKNKIREMADAELSSKLFEFQKELNSERGLLASGGRTSNPGKIKELRKSVARVMTIMHERKLGIVRKVKAYVSGAKVEAKGAAASVASPAKASAPAPASSAPAKAETKVEMKK